MKIRFHLFLYMLCVLLLSSCATATAVIKPTATITQAAALVAPSPILPTATLEPSPTVHPRFGPPPTAEAGFTLGKDMRLLRYTETDASQNTRYWSPEIGGWVQSWMEKGQPIDLTADGIYGPTIPLKFNIFFSSDFKFPNGKYIAPSTGDADYKKGGVEYGTIGSILQLELWYRETGITRDTVKSHYNLSTDEGRNQWYKDVNVFLTEISAGKTITVNGSDVDLTKGFDEIWINANSSMKLTQGLNIQILVMDRKITAVMAVASSDAIQPSKFRNEMLSPLEAVIKNPELSPLPKNLNWVDYQEYGSGTGSASVGGISVGPTIGVFQ